MIIARHHKWACKRTRQRYRKRKNCWCQD